jgi:hypothetical protein
MFPAMKLHFTRADKNLMRAYALQQERAKGVKNIISVRFLHSGDVRAYCADGYTYLIAPTRELFKEARTAALLNWMKASVTLELTP